MANINNLTSYPTATPAADSIVIGSIASGDATNNFLMSDIATYVMSANTLTLQDVCDNGSVTTTGITVGGTVDINSTADISDTLTLSKPTGTGLSVTADATIGGVLSVGSSSVGQTSVTADGFQTNNASFTATSSAVQVSFLASFSAFNTSIGGTLGVTGVSTLGEIDASGPADIADTLTLSKAVGTGLDVVANASIGGTLTLGSTSIGSTGITTGTVLATGTVAAAFLATDPSGAPASTAATGTTGSIVADADYIYVCTATNTWKRVAIATW